MFWKVYPRFAGRFYRAMMLVLLATLVVELLAGCGPSGSNVPAVNQMETRKAETPVVPSLTQSSQTPLVMPSPSVTFAAAQLPTAEPTITPLAAPQAVRVGPDNFPEGVNPLSGLSVQTPENLGIPPVLVSISNYPKDARPQAGLSFSPLVFEIYIGVGVSRFLTVFYGDYPDVHADAKVGPIRSGRIPYESLRQLYRGSLVFASASSWVYPYLDEYTVVYGQDDTNLISARLPVAELKKIAEESRNRLGKPGLTGLLFDPEPPQGGNPASSIWIAYHHTDQIFWRYDSEAQGYLRFQESEEVSRFEQFTDSLTGEPLVFENVVFIFADHYFCTDTFFDIDLQYITRLPALAFRDGKMYEIFWTTGNQEYEKKTGRLRPVRFLDAEGEPFPLRNGQTWVVIVPRDTLYHETVDSQNYFDLRKKVEHGSGVWAIQFYQPAILDLSPEEGLCHFPWSSRDR